ncbi:hypothetical protein JW835_03745 [bacterium]|nr:hypothetical protein [bacterium]RQV98256.1 MAG: hypothetical protein EH221_02480 [bacterium]
MEKNNPDWKEFCLKCKYFDNNMGVCSKLHTNIASNPKSFNKKCAGKLYEPDDDKIAVIKNNEREIAEKELERKKQELEKQKEKLDKLLEKEREKEKQINVLYNNIDKDEVKEKYKFHTLLGYGKLISGFGWLIIIIFSIVLLVGLSLLAKNRGEAAGYAIVTVLSLLGIISGLPMVVFGQLISCFVSIEKNTRVTNELLKKSD